jgi:hypothetical protein
MVNSVSFPLPPFFSLTGKGGFLYIMTPLTTFFYIYTTNSSEIHKGRKEKKVGGSSGGGEEGNLCF